MSNSIQLSDVQFGDAAAFLDFIMSNDMSHHAIASKLLTQGKGIQSLPISDVGSDMNQWLQVHQNLHQQEFTSMGLGVAPDMTAVDFNNEQAYYDWMDFHAQIHAYVGSVLGV